MDTEQLRTLVDGGDAAGEWLGAWGLNDVALGQRNLAAIAANGLPLDLFETLCDQLATLLPTCADPDRALNNLERLLAATRNPLSLVALFERDSAALATLVQLFDTSQFLSEVLVSDPGSFDLLRMTEGRRVAREVLVEELVAEVLRLEEESAVMSALRRFKRREYLRIAYGDIVRGQPVDAVTEQLSYLADAIVEAAIASARARLEISRGVPRGANGARARFVAVAMGKLGGVELNYSSDIDLVFFYDVDGKTDGNRQQSNAEFFDRLARDVMRLIHEPTDLGSAYRVDMRLRPEGSRGPMVISRHAARRYYDAYGRTWERQAYVKARAIAGDVDFGEEFLRELEPWIFRQYLSQAEIGEIKALKRRIERRATESGGDGRDVKTGRGGIRDIEFVIQFLQLLNGGAHANLRTGNTLTAIERLASAGCVSDQERVMLEENYRFLRTVEHRLQMMFDLQTHMIPEKATGIRKLAYRLNFRDVNGTSARSAFDETLELRTNQNRQMLDHLLHGAFSDDREQDEVVDLVLDPDPSPERVAAILGPYGFADVPAAYTHLMSLSRERLRFLSTLRCRHFLAAIGSKLLEAIAATSDPDTTLVNLEKVSDSLGGKAALWELFSVSPASLNLYVELCATSPYLSEILISSPGMIDELMDSLLLDRLPSLEELSAALGDLTRGAEDLDPILHSFKNAHVLRVGVRDILGKAGIQAITGALSDIAEVCLGEIAEREYEKLAEKMGHPTIGEGARKGERCGLAIVAMGKFGGRELNYHSDLDVIFLYEGEGSTVRASRGGGQTTTNRHFFGELGQRIIKVSNRLGPYGRLYEVDPRLRPTGRSGPLATSLEEFGRYFASGDGQLWERQAACRARVVFSLHGIESRVQDVVASAAFVPAIEPADAANIAAMRRRLEETAEGRDLKRGRGGIVDIEFLVQFLQLRHAEENASIRQANTLAALEALAAAKIVSDDDRDFLAESYRTLRRMESRLRMMSATTRDRIPDEPEAQAKLAKSLGYADASGFLEDVDRLTTGNRERFERLLGVAAS